MPRRKKDEMIPEVPPDETAVSKAIKKTKESKKKTKEIVKEDVKQEDDYISDDSDSDTEFSIVKIQPEISTPIPTPEIPKPKIQKQKKVKVPKIAPIIPLDSFIHQQGSGQNEINMLQQQILEEEKKRYTIHLQKLRKENEALKEVKQYANHLNDIDSLCRRMRIDF